MSERDIVRLMEKLDMARGIVEDVGLVVKAPPSRVVLENTLRELEFVMTLLERQRREMLS